MNHDTGLLPRVWARLFGERAGRLSEKLQPSHWLSYVLILSQSAAVLLVFGHAELPLLGNPSWAVRAIAAMGLFVLVATVFAADMALLASLKRMPALARNRQRGQLREHRAYAFFVLLTEAVTLGVVLGTLDADPLALISPRPLIPPDGWAFRAQIVLRVVLVSWTAIQLVIVRGKLPVLLSTLTGTGKEIVGAHVERQLAALDIHGVTLPDTFRTYAAMARPPRRIRTMWNGWLADRELAAEAEEERQVANVVDALEELERRRVRPPTQDDGNDPTPTPPQGGTPLAAPLEHGAVTLPAPYFVPDADPSLLNAQEEPGKKTRKRAATGTKTRETRKVVRFRNDTRTFEDLRAMGLALLDNNPRMTRAQLREKLNCRAEWAADIYAAWKISQREEMAR